MHTCCIICGDESPSEEFEQWKCETCVFECHKQCIQKWVQSSVNKGVNGNCPYCRSPITKLQGVYTKEEVLAALFILCMSRDVLPVTSDFDPFFTSDFDPFFTSDITNLD